MFFMSSLILKVDTRFDVKEYGRSKKRLNFLLCDGSTQTCLLQKFN